MQILDKPRQFDGHSIGLPLYHRGHLSFIPGSTIHMCLLPSSQGAGWLPELIASPIDFDSWSDLWRITITAMDRVGLVHDVYDALRHHHLNVLAGESSAISRQRLHRLEIVVDAKQYSGRTDRDHAARAAREVEQLTDLRRYLLSRVLQDITFYRHGDPRLRIRRIRNLADACAEFRNLQLIHAEGRSPRPVIATAKAERTGNYVTMKMPDEVRTSLQDSLEAGSSDSPRRYINVSDTTDRFLRTIFVPSGTAVMDITIKHVERVGAIAAITFALRSAGCNILTSLSRLYEHGTVAETELVLQMPRHWTGSHAQCRARLCDALATDDLVKTFKAEVGFPRNYVGEVETVPLREVKTRNAPRKEYRPSELLKDLYRNLSGVARRLDVTPLGKERFSLAKELLAEEAVARDIPITRQLFVSFAFVDDTRMNLIRRRAAYRHFVVLTGEELEGGPGPTKREAIIDRIRQCNYFLGLWTEDGSRGTGSSFWPSPWLHWELGVAQSLQLNWHLLISSKIDPQAYLPIAGERPLTIFKPGEFHKKLGLALSAMKVRGA